MSRESLITDEALAPVVPRHDLHLPCGSLSTNGYLVDLPTERAEWRFAGLRVLQLAPGESRQIETGDCEMAVLPMAGSCLVECDGQEFPLAGRDSVFSAVTDFAYVPRDAEVRLSSSAGGEFALPSAQARRRIDAYYGDARAVPVELRGAGRSSRQLNNFLAPDQFDADRLTAVEVLTPGGNWSSYPPHKHDEHIAGGEAELEEIYYFRIDGEDGFGMHRTYDLQQGWDTTVAVYDHHVFLVPSGFHGPCSASPDATMYYLNVLAGPGEDRSLAFTDDPRYAHIRASWRDQSVDARLPLYPAARKSVAASESGNPASGQGE